MRARIKRLMINPEMLLHVMETGTGWRVSKGVPASAKFRGITIDPINQLIHIFVEHPSFEEIEVEKEISGQLETLFKKIQ